MDKDIEMDDRTGTTANKPVASVSASEQEEDSDYDFVQSDAGCKDDEDFGVEHEAGISQRKAERIAQQLKQDCNLHLEPGTHRRKSRDNLTNDKASSDSDSDYKADFLDDDHSTPGSEDNESSERDESDSTGKHVPDPGWQAMIVCRAQHRNTGKTITTAVGLPENRDEGPPGAEDGTKGSPAPALSADEYFVDEHFVVVACKPRHHKAKAKTPITDNIAQPPQPEKAPKVVPQATTKISGRKVVTQMGNYDPYQLIRPSPEYFGTSDDDEDSPAEPVVKPQPKLSCPKSSNMGGVSEGAQVQTSATRAYNKLPAAVMFQDDDSTSSEDAIVHKPPTKLQTKWPIATYLTYNEDVCKVDGTRLHATSPGMHMVSRSSRATKKATRVLTLDNHYISPGTLNKGK
ncbi:uncharacterized protein B0H18DRAFT_1124942 [Fomitopsis serialis]|uniref:uncharacterized protein n=1 Tax=Fomitopsis serialis TaxID=139415 RepID=UPI002007B77A|nr:uncharacterized protein B0H18DRAFT_1124942 [Neoantrodia serialis]KAH9915354.1 hypothetical protein B0H18DRAFT_1124942 [Neoantrodia serialis]